MRLDVPGHRWRLRLRPGSRLRGRGLDRAGSRDPLQVPGAGDGADLVLRGPPPQRRLQVDRGRDRIERTAAGSPGAAMGIGFGVYAGLARSASWTRVAERAVYAVATLVSVAIGGLAAAFALCDFSIQYVAETSARAMPCMPTSAIWTTTSRPARSPKPTTRRCATTCGSVASPWYATSAAQPPPRPRSPARRPAPVVHAEPKRPRKRVLAPGTVRRSEPTTPREPTGERSPRPREAVRPRARPARTELGGDRRRLAGGRRPQPRGKSALLHLLTGLARRGRGEPAESVAR